MPLRWDRTSLVPTVAPLHDGGAFGWVTSCLQARIHALSLCVCAVELSGFCMGSGASEVAIGRQVCSLLLLFWKQLCRRRMRFFLQATIHAFAPRCNAQWGSQAPAWALMPVKSLWDVRCVHCSSSRSRNMGDGLLPLLWSCVFFGLVGPLLLMRGLLGV